MLLLLPEVRLEVEAVSRHYREGSLQPGTNQIDRLQNQVVLLLVQFEVLANREVSLARLHKRIFCSCITIIAGNQIGVVDRGSLLHRLALFVAPVRCQGKHRGSAGQLG